MNEQNQRWVSFLSSSLIMVAVVAVIAAIVLIFFGPKMSSSKLKREVTHKASSLGEGQLSCKLITEVYNGETDRCEPVFQIKKEADSFAEPVVRNTKVLDIAIAKKGQGCLKMTKGKWLPLDEKACEDLFFKNGRLKSVFVSANGKVTVHDPIVKIGERWYLYEEEGGRLTWVIPKE